MPAPKKSAAGAVSFAPKEYAKRFGGIFIQDQLTQLRLVEQTVNQLAEQAGTFVPIKPGDGGPVVESVAEFLIFYYNFFRAPALGQRDRMLASLISAFRNEYGMPPGEYVDQRFLDTMQTAATPIPRGITSEKLPSPVSGYSTFRISNYDLAVGGRVAFFSFKEKTTGREVYKWRFFDKSNPLRTAVNNNECALMAQGLGQAAPVPGTGEWRRGPKVTDLPEIEPGTLVATLEDGVYYSDHSGRSHVGIFVSKTADTMTLVDQWNGADIGRHDRNRVIRDNVTYETTMPEGLQLLQPPGLALDPAFAPPGKLKLKKGKLLGDPRPVTRTTLKNVVIDPKEATYKKNPSKNPWQVMVDPNDPSKGLKPGEEWTRWRGTRVTATMESYYILLAR